MIYDNAMIFGFLIQNILSIFKYTGRKLVITYFALSAIRGERKRETEIHTHTRVTYYP